MGIIFPKFHFNIEFWKFNKEYGVYVSTFGNVKDRYKRLLPFMVANNGYIRVKVEGSLKTVHRLVMLTFKPIPNAEELTVDHLDRNKRNNRLSNLEWCTFEENQSRARIDIEPKKEKAVEELEPKLPKNFESFWIKSKGANRKVECLEQKYGKVTLEKDGSVFVFDNIKLAMEYLYMSGAVKSCKKHKVAGVYSNLISALSEKSPCHISYGYYATKERG